ncbi:MAG: NUDIX domain-containing protein [Clostridia bacterium]|nr:NUDIX domain-containing protein [Clostridia bacterium]
MTRVSAGIIRRDDGRILICKRPAGKHNAHLWEFPGGKQEENESPAGCLIRELQE